jgi:hypothetical protein
VPRAAIATSACPSASPPSLAGTRVWCRTGTSSSAFSVRSRSRRSGNSPPTAPPPWARPSSTSALPEGRNSGRERRGSGAPWFPRARCRRQVARRSSQRACRPSRRRRPDRRNRRAIALGFRRRGGQRLQPHRGLALEALRPVEAQKAAKASKSRPAEEDSGALIPSAMAWRRVASGRSGQSRSASAARPEASSRASALRHGSRFAASPPGRGRGGARRCARSPRNRPAAPHRPRSCHPSRGRARRG